MGALSPPGGSHAPIAAAEISRARNLEERKPDEARRRSLFGRVRGEAGGHKARPQGPPQGPPLRIDPFPLIEAHDYPASITGSRPIRRASWRSRTNTRSPARSFSPFSKRSTSRPRSTRMGVLGSTPGIEAETR
jgi:hypothetical protein